MNAANETETAVCAVCGQPGCPCPHCHGDPLFYYGLLSGASPQAACCAQCGVPLG